MTHRFFLQCFEDALRGDVKDDVFKDAIELSGWAWGMQRSGTMHTSDGMNNSQNVVQDLVFNKITDRSSVEFMHRCMSGKKTDKMKLSIVSSHNSPQAYLIIELKGVMISSFSTNASEDQDRTHEEITLNFSDFKYKYQSTDSVNGSSIQSELQWSLQSNTGSVS